MRHSFRTFLTSLTPDSHTVISLCGWTPGLRTVLRGEVLSCGCLTGDYETRDADVLTIVDAHGPACSDATHHLNGILRRRTHRVWGDAPRVADSLSR